MYSKLRAVTTSPVTSLIAKEEIFNREALEDIHKAVIMD